jgi:glycerol uptake facilitator-like aquaporin
LTVSENNEIESARPDRGGIPGTAFLVAAVVGSGIMAERLSAGNVALVLLANTIATGAARVALILTFGPISGAHLNPVVSLADAMEGGLAWSLTLPYMAAQIFGGVCGTIAAHAMFGLPLVSLSRHIRGGPAQFLSEFIATFGLLSVIWGCFELVRGGGKWDKKNRSSLELCHGVDPPRSQPEAELACSF